MTDLIVQNGIVLAVSAVSFFALGCWYAGGGRRGEGARSGDRAERHEDGDGAADDRLEGGAPSEARLELGSDDREAELREQRDVALARVAELEQAVAANAQAAGGARAAVAAVAARPQAAPSTLSAPDASPKALPKGATLDPQLGAIFAERPAEADDLTQVRGIGKALSRRLNALGVFQLQQIAAWGPEQVEAVAARLTCKDRTVRDWVGQANRLS